MIGVISTRRAIYKAKLQKCAFILVELANYTPKSDFYEIEIDYWAVDEGVKTFIESREPLKIPSNVISELVNQTGITFKEGDDYVLKDELIRKTILFNYVISDVLESDPTLTIYGLTPQEWEIYEEE